MIYGWIDSNIGQNNTLENIKNYFNIQDILIPPTVGDTWSSITENNNPFVIQCKNNTPFGVKIVENKSNQFAFKFHESFRGVKIKGLQIGDKVTVITTDVIQIHSTSGEAKQYLVFNKVKDNNYYKLYLKKELNTSFSDNDLIYFTDGENYINGIKEINLAFDGTYYQGLNTENGETNAPDCSLRKISYRDELFNGTLASTMWRKIKVNNTSYPYSYQHSNTSLDKFLSPEALSNPDDTKNQEIIKAWGQSANFHWLLVLEDYHNRSCEFIFSKEDWKVSAVINLKYTKYEERENLTNTNMTDEERLQITATAIESEITLNYSIFDKLNLEKNQIQIHEDHEDIWNHEKHKITIVNNKLIIYLNGIDDYWKQYEFNQFPKITIEVEQIKHINTTTIAQLNYAGFQQLHLGYLYNNNLFLSDKKSTPLPIFDSSSKCGFEIKYEWGSGNPENVNDGVKEIEFQYYKGQCQYWVNANKAWNTIGVEDGIFLVIQAPGGYGHCGAYSHDSPSFNTSSVKVLSGSSGGSGGCAYIYINLKSLQSCKIRLEAQDYKIEWNNNTYTKPRYYYRIYNKDGEKIGQIAGGEFGVTDSKNTDSNYTHGGTGGDIDLDLSNISVVYKTNGLDGVSGYIGSFYSPFAFFGWIGDFSDNEQLYDTYNGKYSEKGLDFISQLSTIDNNRTSEKTIINEDEDDFMLLGRIGAPSFLTHVDSNKKDYLCSYGKGGDGGSCTYNVHSGSLDFDKIPDQDWIRGGDGVIILLKTEEMV